ncbi:CaiB/BaiF CoA transferase family protein [Rhodococcoides fascians]|uniref:CaiB/BaiF CoA transferase family protein n=1 Tax=Rhodococcoides fascians TaxID=1828 RepID=UPI00056C1108|nr:CoA transferase [Rhodococcus fascians]
MTAQGPLSGVVVADFSRVLAGPYATMMLADMGAEVIKIERPGTGDDTRSWGPPFDSDGTATYFNSVNRNKTSRAIDLSTDEGMRDALEVVARADVLVENFSAGTMDKLGLGYKQLRDAHPGLVYCSITGFGTAAGASLPGYDLLVQAMGGLMSVTGTEGHPVKAGVALVDIVTGLHASTGILAALRHRDLTGHGQHVHTSLLMSTLSALSNQSSAYLGADVTPRAMGNQHPSIAPYEVFDASDRPIALAVGNDRQFRALADTLGLQNTELFSTNTDRVAHRAELQNQLGAILRRQTADHWFTVLTEAGVPAGPVNNIAEAFEFAQSIGLDPAIGLPGTSAPSTRSPLDFSETPVTYRSAPPALGT